MNCRLLFVPDLVAGEYREGSDAAADLLRMRGDLQTYKFLVLEKGNEILVAAGPPWYEQAPYLHAQILHRLRSAGGYASHRVTGGGYLTLSSETESRDRSTAGLAVEFHGKSGDFGRYSSRLLGVRSRNGINRTLRIVWLRATSRHGYDPFSLLVTTIYLRGTIHLKNVRILLANSKPSDVCSGISGSR